MSLAQTTCRHPRNCACHYKDIFAKLGVLSVVLIKTAVFSDATPCRLVCRYWYLQEACWLHLQGSLRRVTTMDCLEDGGSKLLQNDCSCIPVRIVTSQKSGMFDTMFCAQRIINTWWQMNMFFRVIHWDASTLNSHYLITDISTWLDKCNEIKGHNTDVEVTYQIVAIKISFQFSWIWTQCAAYHTFSEKLICNKRKEIECGQIPDYVFGIHIICWIWGCYSHLA